MHSLFHEFTQRRLDRVIWSIILFGYVLDGMLLLYQPISISTAPILPFFGWALFCVVIALIGHYGVKDPKVTGFAHALIQIHFASTMLVWLTYLAARLPMPLYDEALIAADAWMGFNWHRLLHWCNAHVDVFRALNFCYNLFLPQTIVWVTLLYATKRDSHARCFIGSTILACLITSIIAGLFPAVGAYVHYDLHPDAYPNITPAAARIHEALFFQLRNHAIHELPWFFDLKGIITFPSFHAAAGILYIYAAYPLRWLRIPAILINTGMIAAAPLDGGHYLVDVMAGMAVASASIAIISRLAAGPVRSPIWQPTVINEFPIEAVEKIYKK